jgi:hypothetical protein
VPKAGRAAKRGNGVWRIHSAFDLPSERFGQFVLTDEHGGEQLDLIPVVRGEIRSLPLRRRGPTVSTCSRTALPKCWRTVATPAFAGAGRGGAGRLEERPLATAERRAA